MSSAADGVSVRRKTFSQLCYPLTSVSHHVLEHHLAAEHGLVRFLGADQGYGLETTSSRGRTQECPRCDEGVLRL